jgi:DNA polymerase-1
MNKRIGLIDGDIIAFKASASAETPIHWGNGLWTLHCFEQDVTNYIHNFITTMTEELKLDKIIIALSWETNFRYRIYPDYKSNRKNKRKPVLLNFAKEYLEKNWETFKRPDLEADDVLGILTTSPKIVKGEKIIISIDKDFLSIPSNLYNPDHPERGIVTITEEEANYWHMIQTLAGDASDGYAGCPKVGMKTAEKILSEAKEKTYKEMWKLVIEAYAKQGLGEDTALLNARLARVCRREDYDFKKKEVILWSPKF